MIDILYFLFLLSNAGIRYFFLSNRISNYSLLFHYQYPTLEIADIALMFFYAIELAYKNLKNFHCDAIIGLPVVKLCWCGALDVDDCRKSETFLFCNEPTFLRAELAETAVMFFRSVQLSNLISRNFYYHAMQQCRYFNFSDVFCLNYIFVIDAAVKQLVSRSFLQYGASAVTMAAHKIKKKSNLHCRPTRFINSL